MSVNHVAEYLRLSERSVRDLEYRGALPGHRFGSSLRFSLDELDRLLACSRQTTLDELGSGEIDIPPGPLGPLMCPEEAAEYLGLPSVEALYKRTSRLQVPVYRIGNRILRYRAVELDQVLVGQEEPLTRVSAEHIFEGDACWSESERR